MLKIYQTDRPLLVSAYSQRHERSIEKIADETKGIYLTAIFFCLLLN